ncbi:MAG TPA: ComEA family DNA-binding protein [Patescibacteria group bacterium]
MIVYFQNPQGEEMTIPETKIAEKSSVKTVKTIIVDVEGAVFKSGAYTIPENSRVQDALIAAGGISVDADQKYFEQKINLAAKLVDGAKIYIPRTGESILDSGAETATVGQQQTPININTASLAVLDSLPGIGQTLAQRIIDSRPYQAIEDLVTKKVLGQKVFDKIKDQLSVY